MSNKEQKSMWQRLDNATPVICFWLIFGSLMFMCLTMMVEGCAIIYCSIDMPTCVEILEGK